MQKLTNEQVRILVTLADQKRNLQNSLAELDKTEQEYFKMILKYYDLEQGEYQITQQGQEIFIEKVSSNFEGFPRVEVETEE